MTSQRVNGCNRKHKFALSGNLKNKDLGRGGGLVGLVGPRSQTFSHNSRMNYSNELKFSDFS